MGSTSEQYGVVKEQYADFLRCPKSARFNEFGFDTRTEFAAYHGVNRSTVYRWEQDPEFKRAIANDVLGTLAPDNISKIRATLIRQAEEGHVPSIRELRNWMQLDKPAEVDEDDMRNAAEKMTDAEIEAALAEEDARDDG